MSELLERHEMIVFEEEAHVYRKKDNVLESVTRFIGQFHEKFNPHLISTKLSNGNEVKKAKLQFEWSCSAPWGTYIHRLLELHALKIIGEEDIEANAQKQFFDGTDIYQELLREGWKLLKPEAIVWDEDIGLCGTCDLLMINDKNEVLIGDWKTCKNIPKTAYMGKKMYYPIDKVDDCKEVHYQLQMSIYQYMIEKNTDYKVIARELLHIPKEGKAKRIKVDYLKDEVRMMLAWKKAQEKTFMKEVDDEMEGEWI